MTKKVFTDFETRSTVDLRTRGVYAYAEHIHTSPWCLCWVVDDTEDIQIWKLGEPFPAALAALIDSDAEFHAHNAQFERVIWGKICVPRLGWPELPLERWHCTAADAAAMALPRQLGQCAAVLKVEQQVDDNKKDHTLRMARPRKVVNGQPIWWDIPERLEHLYNDCKNDVRMERDIYRVTRRLSPQERRVYLLDQKMNDRGVLLDVPLIRKAQAIVDIGLERANAEIRDVTAGAVAGVTKIADLKGWLGEQGLQVPSVRKSAVRDLLEGDLSDPVRAVLEARAESGRSSVSKLETMLKVRCGDDRARGLLLYYGADTGRWAGRLIQPQNFPRPDVKNPEQYIEAILAGDYDGIDLFAPPIAVVSSLLRGCLRASRGHRFVVGDFAQIEARVLAWIAGQADLVELFATGGKVYETFAAKLYEVPVHEITKEDPRRQFGKNMVLGCGYQMGHRTYKRQAWEQMGVEIDLNFAKKTIKAYREQVPAIVQLWEDMQQAATQAILDPGKVFAAGAVPCKFTKRGGYLWMVLPSGRPLAFPHAHLGPWTREFDVDVLNDVGEIVGTRREKRTGESIIAWGIDQKVRKWKPYSVYGGLLVENAVQAISRDLLAESMLRVEEHGYKNVLVVHDEIVSEAPVDHGSLKEFEQLMAQVPEWGKGCPVKVEGFEADRYRK